MWFHFFILHLLIQHVYCSPRHYTKHSMQTTRVACFHWISTLGRRQTLIATVIGMIQKKHSDLLTAWEKILLLAFSIIETKYPTRSNLREESFILVHGMSRFKPPCGQDIATVALWCWEFGVAAWSQWTREQTQVGLYKWDYKTQGLPPQWHISSRQALPPKGSAVSQNSSNWGPRVQKS